MAGLNAVKAVLSATVDIPDSAFDQRSPFNPHRVGEQLAQQIEACARAESLGYYPALDYCGDRGALDSALVEVLEQLVWLGTSLVREEVRKRLRPFFASVQIRSMQSTVYSMPPVRRSQADALRQLVRHLTPNRARFDLLLTVFRKQAGNGRIDAYVENVVYRHLNESFAQVETGGVKILDQDG